MFSALAFPVFDVGDIINSVGLWVQTRIGVTTIRTLGVAATIYGFFMVFRAATSRQGQSGTRWMQAAVGLIVGFGMIVAPSFYSKVGTNTSDSVQHAVGDGGQASTTVETINLTGSAGQVGHVVSLK